MKISFKQLDKILTVLILVFTCQNVFTADYHLNPVKSFKFSDIDIQNCQIMDFNNDNYDDIAVKNGDLINIYSPLLDSILWSFYVENLEDTWIMYDIDQDDTLEVVTYSNWDTLRIYNQDGSITKDTLGLIYQLELSGHSGFTDIALVNLDSDPQPEIVISIKTYCCYAICGTGVDGYEDYSRSLYVVDALNHTREQIYPIYPDVRGGSFFEIGDFNGDGKNETISTGFDLRTYCEWYPYFHVVAKMNYRLNIFNNAGQNIDQGVSDHKFSILGLDVNLDLPGEEMVVISSVPLFGDTSTTEDDFLYVAKIVNDETQILNKFDKSIYSDFLMELPTLPGYFGIRLKTSIVWHLINGEGSVDSRIFGLEPNGVYYNGNFTEISDDGLEIIQSWRDSLTLFSTDQLTDISITDSLNLPNNFQLSQNYPNPFNPNTTIEYTLNRKFEVNISVYNLLGQRIKVLVNTKQVAGKYSINWDGISENGVTVSSGIYLYRIQAGEYIDSKKMLLLK